MNTIDQRKQARYCANLPCTVTTETGERATATLRNISLSGLQLSGCHRLIQTLFPNFRRDDHFQPITVRIQFDVPTSYRMSEQVRLRCHLVYCRRYQGERYWIGCQFADMDQPSERALQDYLTHFAEPESPALERDPGPTLELPSPLGRPRP